MCWRGRALVAAAVVSLAVGLDGRNVPGASFADSAAAPAGGDAAPTPTPATRPPGRDPDLAAAPEASFDRDKGGAAGPPRVVDGEGAVTNKTGGEETASTASASAAPIGSPGPPGAAENADGDRVGVPGSSYVVDRNKDADADADKTGGQAAGSKPPGPPAENVDEDRVGVPGTSYADGEKRPVKPGSDPSANAAGPPEPPGAAENTEDRVGVPGTSYVDGDEPAKPGPDSAADIVFPRFADRAGAAAGKSPLDPEGKRGSEELEGAEGARRKTKRSVAEGGKRKTKKSNAELLRRLGLVKQRPPAVNHHRKRLASQSREAHRPPAADSKMFVIKLPPEPYYFTSHDEAEARRKPAAALPVSFSSNGKPSRVYHWNIPMLKKMVARKAASPKAGSPKAAFGYGDSFSIDKQATWNDTGDEKPLHRKTAYYAPKKASKEAFRKYFAGNGKPHSFYVIGKSDKPKSTYKLIH